MQPRSHLFSFALLCVTSILCLSIAGCGDTCVIVVGIFPNSSSITTPPTCKLNGGTGIITVGISSGVSSTQGPMSPNLQNIFVTVSGIEAHESALAAEDSSDWQELAPELADQPVQVDLMTPSTSGSSCARNLIRGNRVTAGTYRQIRLRLLPGAPLGSQASPLQNACGEIGFHCVVAASGQKYALALENGAQHLLFTQEHISNGFFNVLPEGETNLSLTFNPYSSLAASSGEAVRITPVLFAHTSSSCDSPSSQ